MFDSVLMPVRSRLGFCDGGRGCEAYPGAFPALPSYSRVACAQSSVPKRKVNTVFSPRVKVSSKKVQSWA